MALDPKQLLNVPIDISRYLSNDVFFDSLPHDRFPFGKRPIAPADARITWNVTCITEQGIVQIPITCTGLPEENVAVRLSVPERQADPRYYWDDHIRGEDIRFKQVVCRKFVGTIYVQRELL